MILTQQEYFLCMSIVKLDQLSKNFKGVQNNATQEFQIHVYCELDLEKSHFNTQ